MADTIPATVRVPVKSAFLSKINWTQAIGMAAAFLAMFGFDLTGDQQAAIILSIGTVQSLITWVLRTWFTTDIVASSVPVK